MTRTSFILATVAVLALSGTAAQSESNVGQFSSRSCSDWLSRPASADGKAISAWMLGYVEGVIKISDSQSRMKGLPASQALAGLDDATVIKLAEGYCRGNPRQTLHEAVSQLGAQLIASQPRVVRSSAAR